MAAERSHWRPTSLHDAEITNGTGPGLAADDLNTDGHLFLRNATVTGSDENGTLQLLGAHIGGQLHMKNIRVTNDSGPLVVLSEAQVAGALLLPASVVCLTPEKGQAGKDVRRADDSSSSEGCSFQV